MKIQQLTPALGAEITGIDVNGLDAVSFDQVRDAWLRYKVLLVRDQEMDIDDLRYFGRRFGDLMRLPYIEPVANYPDVIRVLKEADEESGGVFGGEWHADFSFLAAPPMASLLYALELPPIGGDTLWTNMAMAWAHLPANDQELLRGRDAVHVGAPYGQRHAPPPDTRAGTSILIERDNPEADAERFHPAVVRHPDTGELVLNVNPTYTTRITGLEQEQSDALLQRLHAHSVQPEFGCRVRWRPGTLAIWDNRSTLHYAVDDYAGYRRELIRIAIAGAPPQSGSSGDS